jgi:hypothetical protein
MGEARDTGGTSIASLLLAGDLRADMIEVECRRLACRALKSGEKLYANTHFR